MRLFICGPSSETEDRVVAVLDEIHARSPVTFVAAGPGAGTDAFALAWAEKARVERRHYDLEFMPLDEIGEPKELDGYGWAKRVILDAQPDLAVIFHGPGQTAWMRAEIKAAGLPHLIVPPL